MSYKKKAECPLDLYLLIELANSETNDPEKVIMKRQVRFLAKKGTSFARGEWGEELRWKGFDFINFSRLEEDFSQAIYVQVSNGKWEFSANDVVNTFRGIEADRVRLCAVCDAVFWAKKINAETCGQKSCASTLYNRKRLDKIKTIKSERENWKKQNFSVKEED